MSKDVVVAHEGKAHVIQRCLLYMEAGHTIGEAAFHFGVEQATIWRWIRADASLAAKFKCVPPPYSTSEQWGKLTKKANEING